MKAFEMEKFYGEKAAIKEYTSDNFYQQITIETRWFCRKGDLWNSWPLDVTFWAMDFKLMASSQKSLSY